MFKNKNKKLKKLAVKFERKFNISQFDTILFIRRLNYLGYVVIKGDDLKEIKADKDKHIKKYIEEWLGLDIISKK